MTRRILSTIIALMAVAVWAGVGVMDPGDWALRIAFGAILALVALMTLVSA